MIIIQEKPNNIWHFRFLSTFKIFDKMTDEHTRCSKQHRILQCGPMPNVMVALPNIGGAVCSTQQSLADAHY